MDFDDVPPPPPADSHILSICAALGGLEEVDTCVDGVVSSHKQYVLGDETLACLRDLKRLLRTDERSKDRTVVRALGRWKILQTDLLPILRVAHADGKVKIAQAVLQLFVPLTWPINTESHDALGQQEIQRGYKEAFLQEGVLSSVLDLVLAPLAVPHRERTERDHGLIGLVLTLFRNLLAIKDTQTNVLSTGEKYIRSTMQEDLIVCLQKTEIIPFLLSFAGSLTEREFSDWNVIIMEIFYYMFLERDPGELLAANIFQGPYQHSTTTVAPSSDLKAMLAAEEAAKRKTARIPSSRHGRFGGTLSFQLPTGASFTVHNPAQALNSIEDTLDVVKTATNRGGGRRGPGMNVDENQRSRRVRSRVAARVYLETAHAFVENCFNTLVESVRKDFAAERDKVQLGHYSQFLWLCAFALKFQRMGMMKRDDGDGAADNAGLTPATATAAAALTTTPIVNPLDFDTVTEFLSLRGLAFITGRLATAESEKRHAELIVAVDCLNQFLLSLDAMALHPNDEEYRDAAAHIQNNMYYEHSTIDIAVRLVRDFKPQGSLSNLKAVVETVHVLLKMLEAYSKTKSVMFRKKKKKQGRGGAGKKTNKPGNEEEDEEENDNEEDEEEQARRERDETIAVKETQLSFGRIVNRFATDSILATYCLLLKHYRDLDAKCIYHVTVMFHRIFVTCVQGAPLFYRRAREYPMLFVEILFPKSRADCERIDASNALPPETTVTTATTGTGSAGSKPEPEIEIKPGMSWREEVAVAVALLLERGEEQRIQFVTELLMDVATARAQPPPKELVDGVAQQEDEVVHEPYMVMGVTSEDMVSLRRNAAVRLLLRLLSFEQVEEPEPGGAAFIIPPTLSASHLLASRAEIHSAIDAHRASLNPVPAKTHIRKKRKRRSKAKPTDANPDENENATQNSRNPRKPAPEYKSAAYISDSDTDAEADAEFFAAEAEKRAKVKRAHDELAATVNPVLDEWRRREKAKAEMRAARANNRRAVAVAAGSLADEGAGAGGLGGDGSGSEGSAGWESSSDEEEEEELRAAAAPARRRQRPGTGNNDAALVQGVEDNGSDSAMISPAALEGAAGDAPAASATAHASGAVVASLKVERTARSATARRRTFIFSSDEDDNDDADDNVDAGEFSSPPDPAAISLMLAAGAPDTTLTDNDVNAPLPPTPGSPQPMLLDEDDDNDNNDLSSDPRHSPSTLVDSTTQHALSPAQPPQPTSTPGSRPLLRRRRRPLLDSDSDDDDGNARMLETPHRAPTPSPAAVITAQGAGGDENLDPRDAAANYKRRRVGVQVKAGFPRTRRRPAGEGVESK
ncbi:Topoisomerase 1-associated factor 1 [Geranomyces michiganensis]|nr:Topoisomerase 1-associated factor 1 [Geranomyces michiganensis]